ncbi:hypothetical protein JC827_06065 [Morganella morganii]|nr:hypothetical protein [Morganella morganii]QXO58880.1 hypothetical protein JC827_06065 [Morganella morganii]
MQWPVYLSAIIFSATLPFSVAFADDDDDYELNRLLLKTMPSAEMSIYAA